MVRQTARTPQVLYMGWVREAVRGRLFPVCVFFFRFCFGPPSLSTNVPIRTHMSQGEEGSRLLGGRATSGRLNGLQLTPSYETGFEGKGKET